MRFRLHGEIEVRGIIFGGVGRVVRSGGRCYGLREGGWGSGYMAYSLGCSVKGLFF